MSVRVDPVKKMEKNEIWFTENFFTHQVAAQ